MTSPYLPMSPAPAAVRIRSHQRTKTSQAASGKILSRKYGGQYYKMTLDYNPMRRDQAGPLLAFLEEQEGKHQAFFVPVDQLTGQASTVVGNFANYDNDSKLHMITGTSPTTVSPPAREAGGSLVVSPSPVYLYCSLAGDVHTVSLDRKGLIKISIDLVERV